MYDCAIIGAGLAGLAAALELAKRSLDVVVVEARDRVGGRVENGYLSDGEYAELGGQWIGPGHDSMLELAQRYGLGLIGLPSEGDFVVRLQGRTMVVPSLAGANSGLTPFEVADLGQGLMRFRRLADRMESDPIWARSNAAWLAQDLRRWEQTNLRTAGGKKCFTDAYESAFGPQREGLTLVEALRKAAGGLDLESLVAVNGGLHQSRVEGGVFAICEAMAAELPGRIRLGAPVAGVEHDAASVTLRLADGEPVRAQRVISTLPPKLAAALEHTPQLPENWRDLAEKVAEGNVIKAFLVYERPWWRDFGLSGQMGSDEGPVRVTFDTSGTNSRRGTLLGFFEGAEADSLARRSVTLRQRAFSQSVQQAFGEIAGEVAGEPCEYIERAWSSERYSGGCHGAHFAPGVWTAVGPALAEPIGVLHWAGAEYATRFNGYMEGAVRSGREVAATVITDLSR